MTVRSERRTLILIAVIGLALRLLATPFPGHKYDVRAFLSWSEWLARNPLSAFYATDHATPPDHLPGDLLVFAGIGRAALAMAPGFDFTSWYADLLMRLVPMLADIGLGLLVYVFARRQTDARTALIAAAVMIFNPGLYTTSAVWGQWDSFAALLLMGALLLALRGRTVTIWPLLTYLVLIKPQFIVFGILILLYLARQAMSQMRDGRSGAAPFRSSGAAISPPGRRSTQGRPRPLRDLGHASTFVRLGRDLAIGGVLSVLVFVLVCFPFDVGFPLQSGMRWSILDRVSFAVNRYDDITLGAQNIWALLGKHLGDPDGAALMTGITYEQAGRVLLALGLALAVVTVLTIRPPEWALLGASFTAAMSIYGFPTRVHERYMLPALVLLLFMWPLVPRLLPVAIGLSLTFTCSLVMAMWWEEFWHLDSIDMALAAINLALFGWAVAEIVRRGRERGREAAPAGAPGVYPSSGTYLP